MPGWRGLLRAALALLLAPAVFTAIWIIGNWVAMREVYWAYARTAWPAWYPMFLAFELAGLAPALTALVALRRLTVIRLMLWAALFTSVAFVAWALLGGGLPRLQMGLLTALAVIFGFFNTGLFALLAAVWRWPAASLPRPSS